MASDYAPMPQHFEHELRTIINTVKNDPTNGSEIVFVVTQALGRAYRDGHQAGRLQADSVRYIGDILKEPKPLAKASE